VIELQDGTGTGLGGNFSVKCEFGIQCYLMEKGPKDATNVRVTSRVARKGKPMIFAEFCFSFSV